MDKKDCGFSAKMTEYREQFEIYLNELNLDSAPEVLAKAMKYSLCSGGKRVRPVLCLACAEILGIEKSLVLPYALAIECIHAYSLIHDDLPCMDNDDFRRGKPTNHKVFGEATAVLAGDALNTFAFEIVLKECEKYPDIWHIKAAKMLAECAGPCGMVAGQIYDMESENCKDLSVDLLEKIELNKTAKMIMASVLIPSLLANGAKFAELELFSKKLGIQFQVIDDLLDVLSTTEILGKTVNKDLEEGKLTAVGVLGLDGAKTLAKRLNDECLEILQNVKNSEFLADMSEYLFKRIK